MTRNIPVVIFFRDMYDEFSPNSADSDSFDFIDVDFPLDG